ncbi:MAG TPA: magnesium chelatase ATPase subunit I [Pyrinomonadaceae bacterium]
MTNRNAKPRKMPKKPDSHERNSEGPFAYPFAAVVGQEEMKLALILNVIDPSIGGVLIMGHRGTGKSTAVRALPDLLPQITVSTCSYHCDPDSELSRCSECKETVRLRKRLSRQSRPVPVVELPLGATEDRVCGTIDLEQALGSGVKRFEPGLLARANRGFIYIDEVNLLEDHLVDLLLDVAVTGVNKVERESISVEHPARFVLIGSGNPEEGELRPQLLDRFGLCVEVRTEEKLDQRVEIVERRNAFERDPEAFRLAYADEQERLRKKIVRARRNLARTDVERRLLKDIVRLCSELKVDGHRGELTITRAAKALAAFEGRKKASVSDVRLIAAMALRHRLRRGDLEEAAGSEQIERALEKVFAKAHGATRGNYEGGGDDGRGQDRWPRDVVDGKRAKSAKRSGEGNREAVSRDVGTGADAETTPVTSAFGEEDPARLKFEKKSARGSNPTKSRLQSRQKTLAKTVYDPERGRYARSVSSRNGSSRIALDATLRALMSSQLQALRRSSSPFVNRQHRQLTPVSSDSLRFKLFKRKQGRLFIFALDLSGSMALNRIAQAKRAMLRLLRQSYIKRDSVAIIAFHGSSAKLLLPPSRSILRARRVLDSLGVGGGTPLSAGLECALRLAKRSLAGQGQLTLLLFTDGHPNVSLGAKGNADREQRRELIASEVELLGAALNSAGVRTVLIDTQKRFTANPEAYALARTLGAEYESLQWEAATTVAGVKA